MPQGSILEPLLFIIYIYIYIYIYINDIVRVSRIAHMMFADDTHFFKKNNSLENLFQIANTELENMSK